MRGHQLWILTNVTGGRSIRRFVKASRANPLHRRHRAGPYSCAQRAPERGHRSHCPRQLCRCGTRSRQCVTPGCPTKPRKTRCRTTLARHPGHGPCPVAPGRWTARAAAAAVSTRPSRLAERRDLFQRYADAPNAELIVPTLPAFAASKSATWTDRHGPHDLCDLWALGRLGAETPQDEQQAFGLLSETIIAS